MVKIIQKGESIVGLHSPAEDLRNQAGQAPGCLPGHTPQ